MMQIQRLFLVCLVFQVAYARTVRFVHFQQSIEFQIHAFLLPPHFRPKVPILKPFGRIYARKMGAHSGRTPAARG